jgi:RNA polymerase I-specific transcription initiation factor RRN3
MPMLSSPLPPSLHSTKSRPIRPLLRRATLNGSNIRTREDAGLDDDGAIVSAPPSPSKRARTVTFNPLVEEQVFSPKATMLGFAPDNAWDLEAVRLEVRFTVDEHIRGGNGEAYDALKEVFATGKRIRGGNGKEASKEKIKTHLLALTSIVSLLGKNCSGLVRAVLACDWMGRDEGFVKVYVQFLGNLASAQGAYVSSVLSMLVGKFTTGESSLCFCQKERLLISESASFGWPAARLSRCQA